MNADRLVPPRNYALGIFLIITTALTISVQDLTFKLLTGALTLWQIFTLRGLLAVPVLIALSVLRKRNGSTVVAALGVWPLLRALGITATFLAFYAAIPFLNLSTVGAAHYIAPIYVALLSAYALKEPVGLWGWLGVILGFAGVLILLQPGTDAFSAWTLLPLTGAGFYAIAHLITRTKCQSIPLAALSLAQNAMMLLAGLSISLVAMIVQPKGGVFDQFPYIFGTWAEMTMNDWLVIGLLAIFAIVLGMMLAGAYKAAPPVVIATFEYSYLVFVVIWDIAFFGVTPTLAAICGMILIVLAGLLVMRGRTT